MKASEIARKYGIYEFEVKKYINDHADFPTRDNFWGDIIISDDIDIEKFIQPLLMEKIDSANMTFEEKNILKQKMQGEYDKQEQIRKSKEDLERKQREEQHHLCIDNLREKNIEGYYEYKVISLLDVGGLFKSNSGRVDTEAMANKLNDLGIDGWHLVTAYSNELGKNALSGGAGGVLLGINSTVDENILIFERFVKI